VSDLHEELFIRCAEALLDELDALAGRDDADAEERRAALLADGNRLHEVIFGAGVFTP
jgi:hypothetical protein